MIVNFSLMNIFYLAKDPKVSAQMMCDKHVVKMILESAQMMSTAHRVLDGDVYADVEGLYKIVHENHPSTIWVRRSSEHYEWLYQHMVSLMNEYTYRYDNSHDTERLLRPLKKYPMNISADKFVDPPQCMPDYCKLKNTVSAYRNFYKLEKVSFATWKKRSVPKWFHL